jgi:hypothetical protein
MACAQSIAFAGEGQAEGGNAGERERELQGGMARLFAGVGKSQKSLDGVFE